MGISFQSPIFLHFVYFHSCDALQYLNTVSVRQLLFKLLDSVDSV